MSQERKTLPPCEALSVQDRLYRNRFRADDEAHLTVDQAICRTCPHRACTLVCPAGTYTLSESGDLVVSFEGCLECGACRIVCTPRGLKWRYPRGGRGLALRHG